MSIHETAVVDPTAELDSSVIVGPYAVIGADVKIGAGTRIEPHAVVSGPSTIGERNMIGSFATVGGAPQDMSYRGEPTELIVGNDNQIREYASIHRGTPGGRGKTEIGNNCLLMAYIHIAHDCRIGDNVIMANVATLAGHVQVGERASIGGLVAVHQFCRIGAYSYIGGVSGLSLDVPPYVIVAGIRDRTRVSGINKVGLRRNGFSRETIGNLEAVFRIIYRSPNLLLKDALELARKDFPTCPEVARMVEFFETSKRGVVRRTEED
ncbi:acyl-ACP--UDP-N-acetylglucosamine O-acyltransferase [Desulfofustis glycolicus]|uniref:Acyl-[acyl-carrier-protein]--UDP-N-acetylglucosamine O-acyltransferase n=1 Tax=Desulfofustis glycolicus DSM 9705 TaxID=1121409 RepID=A0A1M5XMU8_9BACT|nr:acyl-ACP--UDP-N-acetylglucosamine O-acyltransferase [Desulfofustis glycolicus]MCB2216629.1 acyl-ACP--UDP-N-acetylglucosamine O-acyltransferase [Desulfobulbaceae bacterium]SHI00878.1 acyl-[acyl-carrier-protein]--UDP-N-acetylglucosamine O-acyltransferase [Desulfofustis glycolicus DSM 9705]